MFLYQQALGQSQVLQRAKLQKRSEPAKYSANGEKSSSGRGIKTTGATRALGNWQLVLSESQGKRLLDNLATSPKARKAEATKAPTETNKPLNPV
ncbi:hypothetical protein FRX31_024013 [Thalictrum thalictroides]|uniref:Uncharacterized protein n=1 Tax=Thalictrum thalictroides TaxID=46969 RepID=A0A7J6VQE0_THATH|nr:hypothetical protein FRX31_024013 [Thalictrum thalictroides]